ncbi:MAG: hypothetical protein CM15mV103_370 [uncultured marine virus]|nr:MAG: hypothetical protein CM15mV103_370 [uncultured marine virus]
MADPAKHKSVSVPKPAWDKANYLKNKIVEGTELSISKVVESLLNKEAKSMDTRTGKYKIFCPKCMGNGFYRVDYALTRKKHTPSVRIVIEQVSCGSRINLIPQNFETKELFDGCKQKIKIRKPIVEKKRRAT